MRIILKIIKGLRENNAKHRYMLLALCTLSWLVPAQTHTSAPQDLLAVIIMVKNEANNIEATLKKFVQHGITKYLVLDTGSTDRTVDVVKEFFAKHTITDAVIKQEPFVNFAVSRNRTIELAEQAFPTTTFFVFPDAEWFAENVDQLIAYCKKWEHDTLPAYLVRLSTSVHDFFVPRVLRREAHVRFKGAVHEFLDIETSAKLPDSIYFAVSPSREGQAKTEDRYHRDLKLLLDEHAKNPTDARTLFYLAQTYSCLNDYPNAYTYYKLCTQYDGDKEQKFQALLRLGVLTQELQKQEPQNIEYTWQQALSYFMQAFSLMPHRAEPLTLIAQQYHDTNNMPLCFMFARHAAELPIPKNDIGLVLYHLYNFDRYYLLARSAFAHGYYALSENAATLALKSQPDNRALLDIVRQCRRIADTRHNEAAA